MSKADKLFIDMCSNIIENGISSEGQDVRPKWEDGTPAHTIKTFGVVNRYNLQEEFPALTLRPTAIKSSTEEILWIWQKKSNCVNDLKTRIWDEWAKPEESRELIQVDRKIKNKYTELPFIKEQGSNYIRNVYGIGYYGNYMSEDIVEYFGKHHQRWISFWENMIYKTTTKNCDDFVDIPFHCCETFLRWVMKYNGYNEKHMLGVLQLDKDYYDSNCYSPDTCVLLTLGQTMRLHYKEWFLFDDKLYFNDKDLFNAISKKYKLKNEDAIKKTVEALFIEGILKTITPNGDKLNRFKLGPRYEIGKAYGAQIREKYLHHIVEEMSEKELEEMKELYPSVSIEEDGGKINVYLDQIDGVLYDLRNTPFSRRIMTNIYNFQDLNEMNLYPCAYSMTFNVTIQDGKKILNGILNQRSQDILAANNWNVVQYSILLMMIAQSVDMIPGELIHMISDAHIYDRHIDIIKEMIERPQFPAPKVRLNPEIKNFYDFTLDDIIVEDYQKNPQIKNIPIAV